MKKVFKFKFAHVLAMFSLIFGLMITLPITTKATTVNSTSVGQVTGLVQTDSSTTSISINFNRLLTAKAYKIEISENKSSWITSDDDFKSSYDKDIYNLNPGRTYYVRITPYSWSYDSNYDKVYTYGITSSVIKVTTTPSAVQSASISETSASETSATLSWGSVLGATGYKVNYWLYSGGSESSCQTTSTSTNKITLKGLKKNTQYIIRIYAYRIDGSYSSISDGWGYFSDVKPLPTKVTNLDCDYFNPSTKSAYASFSVNRNSLADGYEYIIYNYKGKKIASGKSSSYSFNVTDKDLKSRQFYRIKVRAYVSIAKNSTVAGKWSSTLYFSKMNQSDVTLKKSGSKIKASWKKVSGASNYTVYVSTKYNSGYKKVGTTSKTSLKLKTKVKTGKTYYVRIVANKKVGKTTYKATINSKSSYADSIYVGKYYWY